MLTRATRSGIHRGGAGTHFWGFVASVIWLSVFDVFAMFMREFAAFGLTRGEASKDKDVPRTVVRDDEVQRKFADCVEAMTAMRSDE